MMIGDLYSNLPTGIKEGVKQAPAAVLLMAALTAYMSGKWISASGCQSLRDADQNVNVELRRELENETARADEYKKIAFNSVGFLADRAQQSVKISDTATKATEKPTVATVKVPVKPLTDTEKKSIEKPKDAEPTTLAMKLEATKKVLQKTDLSNAQVKKP